DSAILRQGANECHSDFAPCSAWHTWVERLLAVSPQSLPSYAAGSERVLVGACLNALTEPSPLLPVVRCAPLQDASTFWWAADPFWSTAQNERLDVQIDRSLLLHLLSVLRFDGRMDWRAEAGGDALR